MRILPRVFPIWEGSFFIGIVKFGCYCLLLALYLSQKWDEEEEKERNHFTKRYE